MSISFKEEWSHLSAEEQNTILNAVDGYMSYVLPNIDTFDHISEIRQDKMEQFSEQYLRGELTLQGLESYSDPAFWRNLDQFMEPSSRTPKPAIQQTQEQGYYHSLDALISQISEFAYNDTTSNLGDPSTLPRINEVSVSLAR